jgi:hypothetical protein
MSNALTRTNSGRPEGIQIERGPARIHGRWTASLTGSASWQSGTIDRLVAECSAWTVCADWGEREQRKIAFLERRRLCRQTGYWCGGRNVSVCGECSTAAMCMPAWAMGAPIGLRVTSVGTLHTTSPATGRAILGDRKSL